MKKGSIPKLKNFIEIKDSGYDNYNINYNIASCYYKLNKLGYARYYFERTLFFRPFDKDLFTNLKIVYAKVLKDSIYGEQEVMNKRLLFFIPLKVLTILILTMLTFTMVFLIITLVRYKKIFLVIFILFGFFSLVFTFIFTLQYVDYNKKIFVTTQKGVAVHIAPAKDETIITILDEGVKGAIVESTKSFFKINLSEGTSGWIEREKCINNY